MAPSQFAREGSAMLGTVEQLEGAVDTVATSVASVETQDLDRDTATDTLVRLERCRERLVAAIGRYTSDLEARGFHEGDGAYSMANWIATRTGQARATAGSRCFLARKLRTMPETAAAFDAGDITSSHARVLARALNPRTADAFTRDETMLVGHARKLTADQLAQVVEFWLSRHDPDGAEPRLEGEDDRFYLSRTLNGRLKGDFDLGGDLAIRVERAIEELVSQLLKSDKFNRETDPSDPGAAQTTSQRRARALGELCDRAAASPNNPARRQPLFTLHTTVDTLTGRGDPADWLTQVEHAWTAAIPMAEVHLWACDCWIHELVIRRTDGEPLDAGRELRVANRAMRRALVARDGHHCAVPGCDRPVGWCDAHHVVWWTNGGHTDLDNLVLLCRWHHTRIHKKELRVRMVNRRPEFRDRHGHVLCAPTRSGDPPDGRAA